MLSICRSTASVMLFEDLASVKKAMAARVFAPSRVMQSETQQAVPSHSSPQSPISNMNQHSEMRPRLRERPSPDAPNYHGRTPLATHVFSPISAPLSTSAPPAAARSTLSVQNLLTALPYHASGFIATQQPCSPVRTQPPVAGPSPLGLGSFSQSRLTSPTTPPQLFTPAPPPTAAFQSMLPPLRLGQRTVHTAKQLAHRPQKAAQQLIPKTPLSQEARRGMLDAAHHPSDGVSSYAAPQCTSPPPTQPPLLSCPSDASDDDTIMFDASEEPCNSVLDPYMCRIHSPSAMTAATSPPPDMGGLYGVTAAAAADVDMADDDDANASEDASVEAGHHAGARERRRRSRREAPSVSPTMRVQLAAAEAAAAAGITAPLRCRPAEGHEGVCETHRCRRCGCLPAVMEASCRPLWTPRACHGCGTAYGCPVRQLLKRPARLDEGRRRELQRC